MLLPITHTPFGGDLSDIKIPMRVGRALGPDYTPGWVALSEHNVDEWLSAGLSAPPGQQDAYSYGFIPPGTDLAYQCPLPRIGSLE